MGIFSHFMNLRALYIHWSFIQISITNAIVIIVMFVLFGAALVIPFPGPPRKES